MVLSPRTMYSHKRHVFAMSTSKLQKHQYSYRNTIVLRDKSDPEPPHGASDRFDRFDRFADRLDRLNRLNRLTRVMPGRCKAA